MRGLVITQRALTNPVSGSTPIPISTGIDISGAAGQTNLTGSHQFRGLNITTPAQVANSAVNQGYGALISMGTSNGAATALQRGIHISGGTQTAGVQTGLFVTMAAATHDAANLSVGRVRLGGDLFVRGGNCPVEARTFATDATVGNITYTAAQVYGGVMLRDPAGGARADTMPTAADIVAAIPNAAVGDTFEFLLVNTADAAEIITVGAGAGNTLVPASVTPTQNEITRFIIRLTNVTGASEATTMYAMTTGA